MELEFLSVARFLAYKASKPPEVAKFFRVSVGPLKFLYNLI